MQFLCTYKSDYFSIYDDQYECIHYDDDKHHASHDIQGFVDLRRLLQTASSTMMGLGGANLLEIHACTSRSSVRKYCTSNFI